MKKNALLEFRRFREKLVAERETIAKRLDEINEALGSVPLPLSAPVSGARLGRPAGWRAKLAAAQRRRWAKWRNQKAEKTAEAPTTKTVAFRRKKKFNMSPEARAKIAEGQRKKWAMRKAGK